MATKEEILRIKALTLDQHILGTWNKRKKIELGIKESVINGQSSEMIWGLSLLIIQDIQGVIESCSIQKNILAKFEDIKKECRELMAIINKAHGLKGKD